jgi:hypothetical protein
MLSDEDSLRPLTLNLNEASDLTKYTLFNIFWLKSGQDMSQWRPCLQIWWGRVPCPRGLRPCDSTNFNNLCIWNTVGIDLYGVYVVCVYEHECSVV